MNLAAEIRGVYEDCKLPGWDGYGSRAVTLETMESALQFQEAVPVDVLKPAIVPEPDGRIGFEWHNTRGEWLIVSIGSDLGDIIYASCFSSTQVYSSEHEFPLLAILREHFAIPGGSC